MRIERLLRSKFHRSVVVTDAHKTLENAVGGFSDTPGIQITVNSYPRGVERSPSVVVMLPRDEAFEVAREIVRVHRGPSSDVAVGGIAADHVGFHAMSESEFLMIEAVMLWKSSRLRLEFWEAIRDPDKARILLEYFVSCPEGLEDFAAGKLRIGKEES